MPDSKKYATCDKSNRLTCDRNTFVCHMLHFFNLFRGENDKQNMLSSRETLRLTRCVCHMLYFFFGKNMQHMTYKKNKCNMWHTEHDIDMRGCFWYHVLFVICCIFFCCLEKICNLWHAEQILGDSLKERKKVSHERERKKERKKVSHETVWKKERKKESLACEREKERKTESLSWDSLKEKKERKKWRKKVSHETVSFSCTHSLSFTHTFSLTHVHTTFRRK